MELISTILPVFGVVILGWLSFKKGYMPQEFVNPANRLVYHVAIPVMIFGAVSKADFSSQFNVLVLVVTLFSATLVYLGSWLSAHLSRMAAHRTGSFIQCSAHGNLGYIGLPISYYFLGDSGLSTAALIAGFLMILQNVFSVFALQAYSEKPQPLEKRRLVLLKGLAKNPVIISAMAGIIVSMTGTPLPLIMHRFLDILSGLAPPMALLLIGATLSFKTMRGLSVPVVIATGLKLVILPAVGIFIFLGLGVAEAEYLPSLILLATPSATVAYVMSKEMHGDPEFAGAVISLSTLASLGTYLCWLAIF